MHLLQIIICDELNNEYKDVAEELFKHCISGKQAYVTIKMNKVEIEVIELDQANYKFSCNASTWNEAVNRSNITFVPNKNNSDNENVQ